ncbi:lipopolysaccharide transport periplasmic protein LptA [Roseovarius aestuarii]|uniref:Lipopolysaccharide transport periplasmic protein LptA n=3 Tax=Roseovarius aestuarii TaxID=475083 RepID=A0A1X7BQN9_9RHOB|nr:lipopolysaccharide transport periplasmic protein LptA [Roseovarius aestuarii]
MCRLQFLSLLVCMLLAPAFTMAQGAQVAFGSEEHDSSLPVEVTSDNLNVDQNDGTAIFTGNVLIGQGEMRLWAPRVLVVYREDQSGIESLNATGGVTMISGEDAAEGRQADYNVQSGLIEMEGDVLLIQGVQALTGDKLFIDTKAGTARVTGRVKTVLRSTPENE